MDNAKNHSAHLLFTRASSTIYSMEKSTGKILASWEFKEYYEHEHSRLWYGGFAVLGLLLFIYAIATANFLFAIFLVLVGFVMLMRHKTPPHDVAFKILSDGVLIGSDFYRFKELKHFWILYEPPEVKNLYFEFVSRFRPHVMIPLQNQNPLTIRGLLNKVIKEDFSQEDEAVSEFLGRRLKI